MCRLCAVTATNLDDEYGRGFTASLFHDLMLRGCIEEGGQKDGWGVSNGEDVIKSGGFYAEEAPVWRKTLTVRDHMLIGHVRKASTNTGKTERESHPYSFDLPLADGTTSRLIAAHNGWIAGTDWGDHTSQNPHTDSWRALNDLAKRLAENPGIITKELVQDWLNQYESSSQFAFLFHTGGYVYAVRGNRPLFGYRIGNGYAVHTSHTTLTAIKKTMETLYDVPETNVQHIAENTLVRFLSGSPNVYMDNLTFSPKQPRYAGFQASAATPVHQGNVNTGNVSQSTGGSAVPVVAAPVTKPRGTIFSDVLREKRELWRDLCSDLSPLRSGLLRMWAVYLLGYDLNGTTDKFLIDVSVDDLRLLRGFVLPVRQEGDKLVRARPLCKGANMRINAWNHIFDNPGYTSDADIHQMIFGVIPFWLPTVYERTSDSPDLTYINRWTTTLCQTALDLVKAGELKEYAINRRYAENWLSNIPQQVVLSA